MTSDPLLVTARLLSPIAGGEAPHLDSLLEWLMSFHLGHGVPGHQIDRQFAAPLQGNIPIPLRRTKLQGSDGRSWLVAACSAPILGAVVHDGVDHVNKRISCENAGLLAPGERRVVSTSDSWTKSYRLPLRSRLVDRIAWFAVGDRRETWKLLKRCGAIGKKVSIGNGRVASWEVERVDRDLSWFAPSDHGPVLMRPLPVGPALPSGLVGCREDVGACVPPYWHQERYAEILVPC